MDVKAGLNYLLAWTSSSTGLIWGKLQLQDHIHHGTEVSLGGKGSTTADYAFAGGVKSGCNGFHLWSTGGSCHHNFLHMWSIELMIGTGVMYFMIVWRMTIVISSYGCDCSISYWCPSHLLSCIGFLPSRLPYLPPLAFSSILCGGSETMF